MVKSIPVHFVGSKRSRSDSAVKIQKVFRGFLVRKSVNKIAAISKEVEEIEKRISKEDSVELIRKDSKERLKVNETLMNLLFRLDSVRGVDSCVRDWRKTVIKKAIALQEIVDANANVADNVEIVDENEVEDKEIVSEESVGTKQSEGESEGEGEDEGNKRNREVLERMVEENERLMGLMARLVEKNQRQTRLLSSLSLRVEQMERAFICHRLRRKNLFRGRDCL